MKFLFLLLLSGCALPQNKVQIDSRLKPYVDAFVSDASSLGLHIKITDLIVTIQTMDNKTIAFCEYGMTNKIVFNQSYYEYYLSQEMFADIEQVMYHELGHCVLGRGHYDELYYPDNYPKSVMNTYHFSGRLYEMFKHNYILELFLQIPNNFD